MNSCFWGFVCRTRGVESLSCLAANDPIACDSDRGQDPLGRHVRRFHVSTRGGVKRMDMWRREEDPVFGLKGS